MPQNYNNIVCSCCPFFNGAHLRGNGNRFTPLSAELHNSDVLLVFQSPGIDEWTGNQGQTGRRPIISKKPKSTAARMRNSFNRKGSQRDSYDITEAVQCFPGKSPSGRDRKPSLAVRRCCSQHLADDLKRKNYSKVVAFVRIAEESLNNILLQDPTIYTQ